MYSDPIADEIRRLRERRASQFDFDIGAIVKDAQNRDAADDRQVVCRPPRRPIASGNDRSKAIVQ